MRHYYLLPHGWTLKALCVGYLHILCEPRSEGEIQVRGHVSIYPEELGGAPPDLILTSELRAGVRAW